MTNPRGVFNKNPRRVLTVNTPKKPGHTGQRSANTVIVVKNARTGNLTSRENDERLKAIREAQNNRFGFEKREIKKIATFAPRKIETIQEPPKSELVSPVQQEVKPAEPVQQKAPEQSDKPRNFDRRGPFRRDPKSDNNSRREGSGNNKNRDNNNNQNREARPPREGFKPDFKKRPAVNFDSPLKKGFKNLDERAKERKPEVAEQSAQAVAQQQKVVTSAPSVRQIEANKKKVTHAKTRNFAEEESKAQANAKAAARGRTQFRMSAAQLARIASGDGDEDFRRNRKRKKNTQTVSTQEKVLRDITISETITVSELASRISEKSATVIKTLMKMGVMATINQPIDADTAELVATELGHTVTRVTEESVMKDLISEEEVCDTTLEKRAPVVTVMGHVDHGKTSLLDALRKTDVVAKEHGGITQHIGAYEVHMPNGESITFLDTPGHEAFSAMRMRGAKITDIIILVVAADDGIKAQTIEAISHAKAAAVPIIVAVNKMDKPTANFDYVKQSLLQHDIIPDDLGGDVMVIGISALTGQGLNDLMDAVLLQAELLSLKSHHSGRAKGYIVEARLDKIKGFTASLLVQSGCLKVGDILVAGHIFCRIRTMCNDKGQQIKEAGPSTPVEITGLDGVPVAGDQFVVMQNEKSARELVEMLHSKYNDQLLLAKAGKPKTLQEMFTQSIEDVKEVAIIVKADVHGSAEAILHSLNKIESTEVKVKVLHYGAGGINESDIMLAAASKAFVVGFNVRPNASAKESASKLGVEMRFYSVIYHLIDDVKAIMSDFIAPVERENILGLVEIRKVFETSKYGKIAGCYVKEGLVRRNASVRVIRDSGVIHTTTIQSLKRQKDDAKEVKEGFECGLTLDRYEDIRTGDHLEVFEVISEKKTL